MTPDPVTGNFRTFVIPLDGTGHAFYSIPPDNPFVDKTTGKYRAIWAMGLRNPFTFSIRSSGDPGMFVNDVGQVTYEEVNEGLAGANYGWPTCEGPFLQGTTTPCNHPAYTDPVYF